jgi:hypothetical protein
VKCGRCTGLTTLPPSVNQLSRQSGILNISQLYRPRRPVTGIAFYRQKLLDHWKESIIVQIHKKSDYTDFNNYCVVSLLSSSYNILSNILFSRLSPCIREIIGDHQCWFHCNRSHTHQISCIHQML